MVGLPGPRSSIVGTGTSEVLSIGLPERTSGDGWSLGAGIAVLASGGPGGLGRSPADPVGGVAGLNLRRWFADRHAND